MADVAEVLARARRALVPPPRLNLPDWIEAHIRLPDALAAAPGPVRLWPFQIGIAEAIGDPGLERVTVVKPVRVGFTTLLPAALAGYVANDPAPILCLLPAEADCRDCMVSDLEPTFAASPVVVRALAEDREEGERNTILSRRFPGGSLKIVAARAPRNLRRHTARVLFIDEADAMEATAEGAPILLGGRDLPPSRPSFITTVLGVDRGRFRVGQARRADDVPARGVAGGGPRALMRAELIRRAARQAG